ncbi:MAG: apolipoprotein N-acyltransferase [Treponema sp.]|nr:apolipoprotein N-acyltransferase [Treponema sp.]
MICIILQVFYAIFSGIMEAAAISNELCSFGSPFLALFCLVPLYIALFRAKSYLESFLVAALQILTVHVTSSLWLANFHGYAVFTLGASAIGTAFEGGICAGVFMHGLVSLTESRKARLLEEGGSLGIEAYGRTSVLTGRFLRFARQYLVAGRILFFTFIWVFWEWLKSTGDMAYPWGTIFMAAYRWKIFTQVADITGVWGITFIWALVNALFAEGLRLLSILDKSQNQAQLAYSYRKTAIFTAIVWASCGIYGLGQYFMPRKAEKFLNTIVVQQNIDPWEAGDRVSIPVSKRLTEREFNRMKDEGIKPDLVVWSEGVLDHSFPAGRNFYKVFPEEESLCDFIARLDTPFLIGGGAKLNASRKKFSNSAILFDGNGNYSGFYSKKHLVPFAEQIPYAENPLMRFITEDLVKLPGSLTRGAEFTLFTIPLNSVENWSEPIEFNMEPYSYISLDEGGNFNPEATEKYIRTLGKNPQEFVSFTTPICFEDAFTDVCRPLFNMGSEIFINITNDSWSRMESAEYQHFIVASYLAIEYRTTLLRCANSGYSVLVDPAGRILKDLPLFKEDAMGIQVPIYRHKATIYSKYGDILVHSILIFLALMLALCILYVNFGGEKAGCIQHEFEAGGEKTEHPRHAAEYNAENPAERLAMLSKTEAKSVKRAKDEGTAEKTSGSRRNAAKSSGKSTESQSKKRTLAEKTPRKQKNEGGTKGNAGAARKSAKERAGMASAEKETSSVRKASPAKKPSPAKKASTVKKQVKPAKSGRGSK